MHPDNRRRGQRCAQAERQHHTSRWRNIRRPSRATHAAAASNTAATSSERTTAADSGRWARTPIATAEYEEVASLTSNVPQYSGVVRDPGEADNGPGNQRKDEGEADRGECRTDPRGQRKPDASGQRKSFSAIAAPAAAAGARRAAPPPGSRNREQQQWAHRAEVDGTEGERIGGGERVAAPIPQAEQPERGSDRSERQQRPEQRRRPSPSGRNGATRNASNGG